MNAPSGQSDEVDDFDSDEVLVFDPSELDEPESDEPPSDDELVEVARRPWSFL